MDSCSDILRLAVYNKFKVSYDYELHEKFKKITNIREIINNKETSEDDMKLISYYIGIDYQSKEFKDFSSNLSIDVDQYFSSDIEYHINVNKNIVNESSIKAWLICTQENNKFGIFSQNSYRAFSEDENRYIINVKYNYPSTILDNVLELKVIEATNIENLNVNETLPISSEQEIIKIIEVKDISKPSFIKLYKNGYPEIVFQFEASHYGKDKLDEINHNISTARGILNRLEKLRLQYWTITVDKWVNDNTDLRCGTATFKGTIEKYDKDFSDLSQEAKNLKISKIKEIKELEKSIIEKVRLCLAEIRTDLNLLTRASPAWSGFVYHSLSLKEQARPEFKREFHLLLQILVNDPDPRADLDDELKLYDRYTYLSIL